MRGPENATPQGFMGLLSQLKTQDSQRSGLPPQESSEDMSGDGRVLLQPAQGIGVPGAAVGNIDAQPVIGSDEPAPQVSSDAEQHLKLVLVAREAPALDRRERPRDDPFVVGRDRDVAARLEQRVDERGEIVPDLLPALIRDLRWLDVDALADADIRAPGGGAPDVVPAAPQVRLEDEADPIARPPRLFVDADRLF